MASMILDGNGIPPSEVLGEKLTWREWRHIAKKVLDRRMQEAKADAEYRTKQAEAFMEAIGNVQQAVGAVNKNIVGFMNAVASR